MLDLYTSFLSSSQPKRSIGDCFCSVRLRQQGSTCSSASISIIAFAFIVLMIFFTFISQPLHVHLYDLLHLHCPDLSQDFYHATFNDQAFAAFILPSIGAIALLRYDPALITLLKALTTATHSFNRCCNHLFDLPSTPDLHFLSASCVRHLHIFIEHWSLSPPDFHQLHCQAPVPSHIPLTASTPCSLCQPPTAPATPKMPSMILFLLKR